ncbi:YheC/YheD family endospore coat-associated protein [Thermoactinomyces mirandus]|uniref:YheC/YheD family protein n=1 Tax=Thermoactinomyces mirandus TaxID=2756294 RepID=A0A7W1XT84_9BACL|nr:YheC/YheD family protein [Thermoactinomyces mirandus]MBA4602799.1 YheC/YheD family protein [Thermoactinomyces mirandus]
MGLAKVQIQIVPLQQFPHHYDLVMSQALAKKLEIRTPLIWIAFGSSVAKGRVAFGQMNSKLIRISSHLAEQLKMNQQPLIRAHFDTHSLRLRFGPILGILINTHPQEQHAQPFGQMTRFLDECTAAGQSRGIRIAVFVPEHLDLNQNETTAWIKQKRKWCRFTYPLPDVIYNRITSRRVEQQETLQRKLSLIKNHFRIPLFNERFLDKYQVYQILATNERISHKLPETFLFRDKRSLSLFKRYPTVYLKPNNGSLGSGIIKMTRTREGWIYQASTSIGTIRRTLGSNYKMIQFLQQKIGKKPYIAQQGLKLMKFENRPVDFRILVQKRKEGVWKITSAVARIANSQHIVSNLARGGTVRKAGDVLRELPYPYKPSLAKLRMTALDIAKSFEQSADGHFAELGIDLAIDTSGKIWLIEINSKPSKTDDTVINPTSHFRPSVLHLIEYVLHLTNKGNSFPPPAPSTISWIKRRRIQR